MMHPLLASLLVVGATWDAWHWYCARVWASTEEAASLVLTTLFLAALGIARRALPSARQTVPLAPIAALLAAYAAGYAFLPAIMRAAIAIAATLFCLYVATFKERPPIAFWGLTALALPVVPSLQFVLGYPMRAISAALAVPLLQVQGIAVARQGTFLTWRGEMVQFDAPCSGVNMLWTGLLLTLMGCVWFRLRTLQVIAAVTASLALAIVGNTLRAASLFYVETGIISDAPAWWHEGIGLAAFVLSAAIMLNVLSRLAHAPMFPRAG
jgi:exosortase/archaeosortase family protein